MTVKSSDLQIVLHQTSEIARQKYMKDSTFQSNQMVNVHEMKNADNHNKKHVRSMQDIKENRIDENSKKEKKGNLRSKNRKAEKPKKHKTEGFKFFEQGKGKYIDIKL